MAFFYAVPAKAGNNSCPAHAAEAAFPPFQKISLKKKNDAACPDFCCGWYYI
jgi:hypothetical protein